MNEIHRKGPFGGCDEQAEHDALHAMMGHSRAERLHRLWVTTFPATSFSPMEFSPRTGEGKAERWRERARRDGFTEEEIEAFAHVARIEGGVE